MGYSKLRHFQAIRSVKRGPVCTPVRPAAKALGVVDVVGVDVKLSKIKERAQTGGWCPLLQLTVMIR